MNLLAVIMVLAVFAMVDTKNAKDSKYCKKCNFHTMCKTTSPGDRCESFKSKRPRKADIQLILQYHNKMRNRVAMGIESRGNPGPQFKAANMMKMEWDNELAKIAQRAADQCYNDHDCKACRTLLRDKLSVGQNIAIQLKPQKQKTVNFTGMIGNWYTKEVDEMDKNYAKRYMFGKKWNHYSQMVWWNSRLVGCGAVFYDDCKRNAQLLVCNYRTGANVPGAKIYEVGLPASQCPEGTAGTDEKYKALCVIQQSGSKKKFSTDGVVLGLPAGVHGTSMKCEKKGFRLLYETSA